MTLVDFSIGTITSMAFNKISIWRSIFGLFSLSINAKIYVSQLHIKINKSDKYLTYFLI